jgi:hypothetical protein
MFSPKRIRGDKNRIERIRGTKDNMEGAREKREVSWKERNKENKEYQ